MVTEESTGPRTLEGGIPLAAQRGHARPDGGTLIPPGEDGRECQRRLAAWPADLSPCNPFEEDLVRQAVAFSWRLDRADRVQAERMTERFATVPVEEERRRGGEDLGHPTS